MYVINKGNMWHIISRANGKTLGFATNLILAKAKMDAIQTIEAAK